MLGCFVLYSTVASLSFMGLVSGEVCVISGSFLPWRIKAGLIPKREIRIYLTLMRKTKLSSKMEMNELTHNNNNYDIDP